MLLGLTLAVLLTWLNYRGIQASARLSKTATFTFLTLVIIFALAGAHHGSVSNLHPLFSHTPLLSILLVWQVVPWLVSGFESVGKVAEEASPGFAGRDFSVAILLTIFSGLIFFLVVITAVSYVTPWQSLNSNQQFPTALAFERALHGHWIVVLIMSSALVALVQAFNANIVASSRLLFAMSRRNLLNPRMSRIHPQNQTPSTAVVAVGLATALTIFLGEALLVPILEVGAVSAAVAWMAACASYYKMKPHGLGRAAAVFGLFVTSVMILVKLLPWVPGHFTRHEWVALAMWGVLGAAIRATRERDGLRAPEIEVLNAEG
jgi:amino acid transporter